MSEDLPLWLSVEKPSTSEIELDEDGVWNIAEEKDKSFIANCLCFWCLIVHKVDILFGIYVLSHKHKSLPNNCSLYRSTHVYLSICIVIHMHMFMHICPQITVHDYPSTLICMYSYMFICPHVAVHAYLLSKYFSNMNYLQTKYICYQIIFLTKQKTN